jgi:hypothetical protein
MDREWLPLDNQLRLDALRQAVQFNRSTEPGTPVYARHVVTDAREFYEFLKGNDDE